MPPEAQRAARTAAISGARALVAEVQFDALVTLLVRSGAVPSDAAQAMLIETARRLSTYVCSFEPEWRPCRAEIAHNVRRLEKMAREIGR